MPLIQNDTWSAPDAVRVRASAADPHAGLRGRDYIAARQLGRATKLAFIDAGKAEATLNFVARYPKAAPTTAGSADCVFTYVFMSGHSDHPSDCGDRRFVAITTRQRGAA